MFVVEETQLGRDIMQLTREFDTNLLARTRLLRYALAQGRDVLETVDAEVLARPLMDWASPVHMRETAKGHLMLLQLLLEKIRRGSGLIVTPENTAKLAGFAGVRDQWLQSTALRDAVTALQKVLQSGLFWFNVQVVCELVQHAIRHWDFEREEGYLPHLDLQKDEQLVVSHPRMIRPELVEIDREAYERGAAVLRREYMPACERVAVRGDYAWMFLLTEKQLRGGAATFMGASDTAKVLDPEGDAKLREQVNPPRWRERKSGLIVPGTLC